MDIRSREKDRFYRFADWIFERINEVRRNDLQRQYLFSAFRQSIQNEQKTFSLADQIPRLSEQLKKSLESVDSATLMTVITDTIIDLSRIYPQIFQAIFVVSISLAEKTNVLHNHRSIGYCGYSHWLVH